MPHSKSSKVLSVRRNKKLILFFVFTVTLITWMNFTSFLSLYTDHGQIKRMVQPPALDTEDDDYLLWSLLNSTGLEKSRKLEILAEIVQNQVLQIQDSSNCKKSGYTLSCGHDDRCGLGCQIHHRAACLIMSYVMNIPLIHDEETAWPFSNPWHDAFKPLGSNCTRNEKTIYVKWRNYNIPLLYVGKWCHYFSIFCPKESQFEFPLLAGIPVSSHLKLLVEENVQNPFLWVVGQFVLLTMQLTEKQGRIVDDAKAEMQLLDPNLPLVGLHVRRTDKIREAIESHHEIDEYVKLAQKYFQFESKLSQTTTPRTIFVASDDHTILKQVQMRYPPPTWRIVGMKSDHTFTEQWERKETLHEIVRDVIILSECDYIVCGLSSNICRLLYEMLAGQQGRDGQGKKNQRLKSLDGHYNYLLQDFVVKKALITSA